MHMNNLDIFEMLEEIKFCQTYCCLNLASCKEPGDLQSCG